MHPPNALSLKDLPASSSGTGKMANKHPKTAADRNLDNFVNLHEYPCNQMRYNTKNAHIRNDVIFHVVVSHQKKGPSRKSGLPRFLSVDQPPAPEITVCSGPSASACPSISCSCWEALTGSSVLSQGSRSTSAAPVADLNCM